MRARGLIVIVSLVVLAVFLSSCVEPYRDIDPNAWLLLENGTKMKIPKDVYWDFAEKNNLLKLGMYEVPPYAGRKPGVLIQPYYYVFDTEARWDKEEPALFDFECPLPEEKYSMPTGARLHLPKTWSGEDGLSWLEKNFPGYSWKYNRMYMSGGGDSAYVGRIMLGER